MKITRREWLKGVPAFLESRKGKDGTVSITIQFLEQLRDAVNGEPNEPWDDTIPDTRAAHLAAVLKK